jgi:MerR family transcriptional regulator, light-induced transcriptional regulator
VDLDTGGFGIGELARRTDISVPTLRAWERRYGYPVPRRLESGHRRYTHEDVEALLEAQQSRADGATLPAALERARVRAAAPRESLFAALRDALPDVAPVLLTKSSMRVVSRAIEDEAAGRAERPVLLGAFQADEFWRSSEHRWRDLSRTSSATVVLGATPRGRRRGNVWEIGIAPTASTTREWAVVCDSSMFSAAVVGVERLGDRDGPDDRRSFEALWTVEPLAVREVARVGLALAAENAPELRALVEHRLRDDAVVTRQSMRSATALTNRIVAYLASVPAGRR